MSWLMHYNPKAGNIWIESTERIVVDSAMHEAFQILGGKLVTKFLPEIAFEFPNEAYCALLEYLRTQNIAFDDNTSQRQYKVESCACPGRTQLEAEVMLLREQVARLKELKTAVHH